MKLKYDFGTILVCNSFATRYLKLGPRGNSDKLCVKLGKLSWSRVEILEYDINKTHHTMTGFTERMNSKIIKL